MVAFPPAPMYTDKKDERSLRPMTPTRRLPALLLALALALALHIVLEANTDHSILRMLGHMLRWRDK